MLNAAPGLWRDPRYRRIWIALLFGGFAGQIAHLALALTAAVLLQATPAQIGLLAALGNLPYALFLLPAGVWLDRVRKLPVYIGGELVLAATLAVVPLAWVFGGLSIELLGAIAFIGGCVSVTAGTAGQIVLTHIVRREQLVEAHAKSRIAYALAEVAGPGLAGLLIRLCGTPLTLLLNAGLLLGSVAVLRGLRVDEAPLADRAGSFRQQLVEGLRFVAGDRLLLAMALAVGLWQVFQTAAMVTQVLFATRLLGLDELRYGFCLGAAGLGSVIAGTLGHRLAHRCGPGPSLIGGIALSGAGWLQLAVAPSGPAGVAALMVMLLCFSASVVLIFSNLLALRQAVTPPPMLARMTGTMRWLTLFPALPGTLLGGTLAEHYGLRFPLVFGGLGALLLAAWLWRHSVIRRATALAVPAGSGRA